KFRDGGFFEKGDILVRLDDRDYQAEVKIAQSTLMSARQALLEEQARAEQAREDWTRLGVAGEEANALVLRTPQLEAARARVLSAEAQLQKATLNLERTKIVAPYAGRILQKLVDVGQVVSGNSPLAEIYAVDYVEIRLPIKNRDLALLQLPEQYRDADTASAGAKVEFHSDLTTGQIWTGRLVRTEGAIDDKSRQLYAVAQITNPYAGQSRQKTPLKIGQYVTATIDGLHLRDALVIPNSAIYQGSYVYVVEDGLLKRREIETRWQNDEDSLVAAGLKAGERLVVTPLGRVSSGTPVVLASEGDGERPDGRNAAGASQ
ncbi:efflux RND transporter periplasmic adaptor subunit, partial [Paremcibacter congregatus]|uniref:efflux RND transporter periplasmic adaptor subunit n=1 Tax=Paremcibacter congregatus TaxID=2043170 RepID=UPI003A8FAB55